MLAKHNHFVPTAWPFCPAVPENGTKKCARMWKIKSPLSVKCNFLIQEPDFISVCCGRFDLPKIHFGGYFSYECVCVCVCVCVFRFSTKTLEGSRRKKKKKKAHRQDFRADPRRHLDSGRF